MLVPTQIDRRRYILLGPNGFFAPEVGAAVEAELGRPTITITHGSRPARCGRSSCRRECGRENGGVLSTKRMKLGDIKQGYLAVRVADASLLESLKGTSTS